jgi:hypothetical protein
LSCSLRVYLVESLGNVVQDSREVGNSIVDNGGLEPDIGWGFDMCEFSRNALKRLEDCEKFGACTLELVNDYTKFMNAMLGCEVWMRGLDARFGCEVWFGSNYLAIVDADQTFFKIGLCF